MCKNELSLKRILLIDWWKIQLIIPTHLAIDMWTLFNITSDMIPSTFIKISAENHYILCYKEILLTVIGQLVLELFFILTLKHIFNYLFNLINFLESSAEYKFKAIQQIQNNVAKYFSSFANFIIRECSFIWINSTKIEKVESFYEFLNLLEILFT